MKKLSEKEQIRRTKISVSCKIAWQKRHIDKKNKEDKEMNNWKELVIYEH